MRILVVEDEPQLAGHITRALARHGHRAVAEYDGAAGLQRALREPPDLVVLDLNLPTLGGVSVLTQLRAAQSPARVLILTARGEVEHRVRGLNAGADDYLAKPFSMEELVARIEARTELSERVWQRDHQYDTRTVEIFITRLRKKVDAGEVAPLIHTARSVGYTIRAPFAEEG